MLFLSFPIFTHELFVFQSILFEVHLKNIFISNWLQGDWSPNFWIFGRFRSKRWIESWICRSCRTGKLRSRGRIKFRCPRKVGTLTLVFVRKGVFEDVNCAIALKVMIHYHKWTSLLLCEFAFFLCFKFTYVQVRIQEKNPDLKKKEDRSFCGITFKGRRAVGFCPGAPPVDGWWAWLFWPCLSWSMHLSMPRGGGKVGFVVEDRNGLRGL